MKKCPECNGNVIQNHAISEAKCSTCGSEFVFEKRTGQDKYQWFKKQIKSQVTTK